MRADDNNGCCLFRNIDVRIKPKIDPKYLEQCYGMNVYAPLPPTSCNLYIEVLIATVMVLGSGPLGGHEGMRVDLHEWESCFCRKDPSELPHPSCPVRL